MLNLLSIPNEDGNKTSEGDVKSIHNLQNIAYYERKYQFCARNSNTQMKPLLTLIKWF